MTEPKDTVDRLGLSIRAEFVPFSQSRNKAETDERGRPRRTLNWRVTLVANGRDILATDYSAGAGHCPAYQASVKKLGSVNSTLRDKFIEWECENGRESHVNEFQAPRGHKPILPDSLDVIASLVMDSSVLDESSFEDWASSLGYDVDSRKAESIYRACLAIALQLRNGIGESGLAALRDAFQDY